MFAVQYLPEWIIHLIFSAGVVGVIFGFVLSFVPVINSYKFPIQIISILVLTLGVYLEGGLADTKIWKMKVLELEAKVKAAEANSQAVNVIVQEKLVTKTKVIKEKADTIVSYIDREVKVKEEVIKYVEHCPLPKDIIDVHNAAATINRAVSESKK
jgi:uncharacterized membrane protein